MEKFVYSFSEGSKDMKDLLGGKGANLAEMTNIGLPVPFGFTITTEVCSKYYEDGKKLNESIKTEIFEKLKDLEKVSDKKFGSVDNPLLVSVRSGAKFSMPGMMDTILNLGLNDISVEGLAKLTSNPRFAYDSYRRFIQMFGDVVMEISKSKFDKILEGKKEEKNRKADIDLTVEDLKEILVEYKALVKNEMGEDFPQDPTEQLMQAVSAVFRSWNNDRAILYRKLNNIPDSIGTAVNVQSMVFGNMGETSGTGVAFTRNPINGNKNIFGEFLVNAQGEDVVAGIRTPQGISEMSKTFPAVYDEFEKISEILEAHYKDMQDMEFTVENNKLFMLQTRTGKRTAAAALKISVDMEEAGIIDKKEALKRIESEQIDQLLHPTFSQEELKGASVLGKGLPASPGAATGKVYFNASDAVSASENGEKTILVRQETSPEDLAGMVAAEGILTARGGMTSHAAVVARGMGKCCVAGCDSATVSEAQKTLELGGKTIKEGDYISIDGSDGSIYEGQIPTVQPKLSEDFNTIMNIADEMRQLKVRTNADNPKDARQAIEYGAEGIGLCRTEHMFFEEDRIPAIRKMILSDSVEDRILALDALLPYQKSDFKGIYEAMEERPVTIRLLDPPLHEFLPTEKEDIINLASNMNVSVEMLEKKIEELQEFNPMLGHRGCRLGITYPEIVKMQTKAIITSAIEVKKEKGFNIIPEIMVPLVGIDEEFKILKDVIIATAEECFSELGERIEFLVGTMLEIPRAALIADKIAKDADFFSFGTNDLTQMTFGFSRDDTGSIINKYVEDEILKSDPFQSIDVDGVGTLVKMAIELAKKEKPSIKLGVCGEHGGDPKSIEFFNSIGLDYVSCSPFRVPVARIAAAKSVIDEK